MLYIVNLLSIFLWNIILRPTTKKGKKKFLFIVFIQLFCLITFRKYTVGFDSKNYYRMYLGFAKDGQGGFFDYLKRIEVGYAIINKIAYYIAGENYIVLWGITALIILIPFFYYICNYSNNVFLSICTYICLGYYYNSMNQIRQMIAVSICLLAYIAVMKKKYAVSIIVTIIATLFHASAVIIVIVPIAMLFIKSFDRWIKIIPVVLLVVFLNFEYIVRFVTKYFNAYNKYFTEDMQKHLTRGGSAYFYVFLLILVMAFAAIKMDKMLIRKIAFKIQLFALVMAEVIIVLSVNMHIFKRFSLYFEICTCTLLPNVYMVLSKGRYRQLIKIGLFISAIFVHHYYLFFAENHMGRAGVIPYILFNR